MTNDLEKSLRSALRPVDPDEDFADRVLARVQSRATGKVRALSDRRGARTAVRRSRWWFQAAAAATLVVGIIGVRLWQEEAEREAGLQARQQLMEALRVTSEKLDLAYQVVNSPARDEPAEQSGA